MCYRPVPDDDQWKISFLKELIDIKSNEMSVDNFDNVEYDEIIEYLCTS